MSRLLYYPSISIPNASWLCQSLLYWDGVATIVPVEYLHNPQKFTPFARSLIQDGVIQTVQPDEYAYSNPNAFTSFLNWVDSVETQALALPNEQDMRGFTRLYNIHAGKLGFVGEELERRGLAKRFDSKWYSVSYPLSKAFMTFLAILIGQEADYIPTTDTYQGISSLFVVEPQNSFKNSRRVRNELRNSILDKILPVPSSVDDYTKILRFKDHYHYELVRFREYIEEFIITLDGLPEELREERLRYFLARTNDELEELKEKMRWFRAPKINLGTIFAVLPTTIEFLAGNPVTASAGLAGVLYGLIRNADRGTEIKKPLALTCPQKPTR